MFFLSVSAKRCEQFDLACSYWNKMVRVTLCFITVRVDFVRSCAFKENRLNVLFFRSENTFVETKGVEIVRRC